MKTSIDPSVNKKNADSSSRALVEAVALKKKYGAGHQSVQVLRGVDLAVKAGEFVVIMGPSGSGKSTLLHLLGGLDRPTEGTVHLEGRDLELLSDRELARVRNEDFGFVFQFYHLVPELTALENVMLPAWMKRRAQPQAIRQRALGLLDEVGLEHRASHRPSELSGGEQQRVAVARALMNSPRIVFCDEPTGNLDSQTGESVLKLLLELNRQEKTTFIIVTHEPSVAQMAGRVLSLKDGQLWD